MSKWSEESSWERERDTIERQGEGHLSLGSEGSAKFEVVIAFLLSPKAAECTVLVNAQRRLELWRLELFHVCCAVMFE